MITSTEPLQQCFLNFFISGLLWLLKIIEDPTVPQFMMFTASSMLGSARTEQKKSHSFLVSLSSQIYIQLRYLVAWNQPWPEYSHDGIELKMLKIGNFLRASLQIYHWLYLFIFNKELNRDIKHTKILCTYDRKKKISTFLALLWKQF